MLLTAACALLLSQPPSPSSGEREGQPNAEQANRTQPQPTPIERGTSDNPLIVRESRSDVQAAEDRQDRQDEQANRRYALWLSFITTIVVAAQVWLLLRQNRIIAGQNAIMAGQREAAVVQSGYMKDGLEETRKAANAAEASATIALAQKRIGDQQLKQIEAQIEIARTNAEAAKVGAQAASDNAASAAEHANISGNALATQKEIERAYIALSHSGVVLADSNKVTTLPSTRRTDDDNPDSVELVIEITNHGRTPGDVLGGFYGFIYQPASVGPDLAKVFGGGRLTRLFVLPGDKINFGALVPLGTGKIAKLISEEWSADMNYLWFVGEVDYRDRFDKIHRCGYARRYDGNAKGFVFGPETGPLNYDRPLTQEEIAKREYDKTDKSEEEAPS